MSERSKMQAAVTEIDEKKAHSITLSATEKSALDGQRAQLIKQIKLLDQYLKESSLNKK